MKKKTYQQPKIEVVQLDLADIIATSTQADVRINNGNGFLIDEEDW